jgi:DNA-binding NarL/FixJ family response regulator
VSAIRVAFVEDHSLLSEGLRRLLASEPDFAAVGDWNGVKPRQRFEDAQADIVLVDCRVRGALNRIRGGARPWAIVLAPEADMNWGVEALAAGAKGILAASATLDDLYNAIRAVHDGHIWATEQIIARAVNELATVAGAVHTTHTLLVDRLSSREYEVVRNVSSGLSNQEIADRLAISQATVKAHLTSIFQKLGIRHRAELVAVYHGARGLVPARLQPASEAVEVK